MAKKKKQKTIAADKNMDTSHTHKIEPKKPEASIYTMFD